MQLVISKTSFSHPKHIIKNNTYRKGVLQKIPLLLTVLLLFSVFPSLAQGNLNALIKLDSLPSDLTAQELANFQETINDPTTQSYDIIMLEGLTNLYYTEQIAIKPPNGSEVRVLKKKYAEFLNAYNFSWTGEYQNDQDYSISMVSVNGSIEGEIAWDTVRYLLTSISKKYLLLIKPAYVKHNPNCGNIITLNNTTPSTNCTPDQSSCKIDLLVVYPQNIADKYSNEPVKLTKIIDKFVSDLNETFYNSKIKHTVKLKSNYLLEDPWTYYNNPISEANALSDLLITPSSKLAKYRQSVRADLVVFLSKGPYETNSPTGKTVNFPAQDLRAVSVVLLDMSGIMEKTFTHEVGHLLGAGHAFDDDGCSSPACAYSLIEVNLPNPPTYKMTIMKLLDPSTNAKQVRYLNFSNPNVKIKIQSNYVPFGTNESNNACVVQNHGCIAANIMSPFCGEDDLLTGEFIGGSKCNPQSLRVGIDPNKITCQPVAFYSFEYSFDGMNYLPACPFSTQSYCLIQFSSPLPIGQTVYVRLSLIDILVKRIFIKKFSTCGYQINANENSSDPSKDKLSNNMSATGDTWLVKPNPVYDIFQIDLTNVPSVSDAVFTLTDACGVELGKWKNIPLKGDRLEIDISDLPTGIFYLQLKTANQQPFIQKIIHINK